MPCRWLGLAHGWRSTFWAITAIGVFALAAVAGYVSTVRAGAAIAAAARLTLLPAERLGT